MNRFGYKRISYALVAFLCAGMSFSFTPVFAATAEKPKLATKAPAKPVQAAKPLKSSPPPAPLLFQGEPVFAVVNGNYITIREYKERLDEVLRKRFYHGSIPEGQAEALTKDVTDQLIERVLLLAEAERRGIRPDLAKYDQVITKNDARFAEVPGWLERREELLPKIKLVIVQDSLLEQLEKAVRNVPAPTPTEVRAYYDKHPELFTEPEKPRLSIILLKVESGAPAETWDQARAEAKKIYDRIVSGNADFAAEARLYSQHDSAANGGDMGYVHGGMLPQGMERKLADFKIGVVQEPITALQGVAIYRLDDLIPAKLQDFPDVEKRAADLQKRDWENEAWQYTINLVRKDAKIEIAAPQVIGGK